MAAISASECLEQARSRRVRILFSGPTLRKLAVWPTSGRHFSCPRPSCQHFSCRDPQRRSSGAPPVLGGFLQDLEPRASPRQSQTPRKRPCPLASAPGGPSRQLRRAVLRLADPPCPLPLPPPLPSRHPSRGRPVPRALGPDFSRSA